jgi:hypothetical protein
MFKIYSSKVMVWFLIQIWAALIQGCNLHRLFVLPLSEKEEGLWLEGIVTQLRGLNYPCVFRGRGQANIRYGITEITWAFGTRVRTDVAMYMLRHIRLEDSQEKNVHMMLQRGPSTSKKLLNWKKETLATTLLTRGRMICHYLQRYIETRRVI